MASGAYKIGQSGNPGARVQTLSVGMPSEPCCIGVLNTDHPVDLESLLHRPFAACRIRGEWFRLSSDDVSWFTALTAEDVTGLVGQPMTAENAGRATHELVWLFSSRLRQLREHKGFSRHRMAKTTGINRTRLAELEKPPAKPTWEEAVQICLACGVCVSGLLAPWSDSWEIFRK